MDLDDLVNEMLILYLISLILYSLDDVYSIILLLKGQNIDDTPFIGNEHSRTCVFKGSVQGVSKVEYLLRLNE